MCIFLGTLYLLKDKGGNWWCEGPHCSFKLFAPVQLPQMTGGHPGWRLSTNTNTNANTKTKTNTNTIYKYKVLTFHPGTTPPNDRGCLNTNTSADTNN